MNLVPQKVRPQALRFVSGGQEVAVTAFRPVVGLAPALLVVPGAGGVDAGDRYVGQLARAVAARGYATYLVAYFDRTATVYADDATIQRHFGVWVATLRDAVDFIASQPGVDARRIGTFGYSLGGYLAVAHAATDERVRAVVELAGGVSPGFSDRATRLPPTLVLHGRDDQRVPFAEAQRLEAALRKLGTPTQTMYLPGERHLLSPIAALRALDAALKFFAEHLR